MIQESRLKQIIKESIIKVLSETKHTNWTEVKYFHPQRQTMPNGSHYQRGGFLQECRRNLNSFILDEGVHGNQYGMAKYRGGIIVFSTDVNAVELDKNKIINKIKQVITTFKNRLKKDTIIHNVMNKFNDKGGEYIGAYSVGNFFKGKYVGDNGEMYNERSLAIEINGLSSESLLKVAEMIAQEFMQETVLVKDLNKNKIYTADSIPMADGSSLDAELDKVNTDVE